jgi:hypothetical protein
MSSSPKSNILYNTAYVVSYMDSDVFIETDEVNDAEKTFIRSCIYRQDLLNIFGLDEFVETTINNKIAKLIKLLRYHTDLYDCMLIASKAMNEDDGLTGLMILFSFDYLHLAHPCISEYIETGNIKQELIDKLKMELDKIISA